MKSDRGFTLVELVIVVAIVGILAAAVLPLGRWAVKRQREYELQQNLRILRDAIDKYHDLALAGAIEVRPGGTGYPEDLEVLVEGVEIIGEIPSPVPGVSGGYSASGLGLAGGYSGGAEQQAQAGTGMPLGAVGGPAAAQGGNALQGGAGPGGAQGLPSFGQNAGGNRGAGAPNPTGGQRGGGLQGGLGNTQSGGLGNSSFGSSGFGNSGFGRLGSADRRGGRGASGGADVDKMVFLRRLPIDPFTGESDWGLRCYGDSVDDRSWCGRNVFDVYSRAPGRAMDGRPYREW